jgi:hypothetical protein
MKKTLKFIECIEGTLVQSTKVDPREMKEQKNEDM